ncbi:sulfur carrier protein ThiS [Arachidicoccus terrestris]|uniref:sulfur carrier protein ThiS n=1 Tax=Arachidicoccus terrestris TaxID=2875539 RepID=UPI001CC5C3C2|nr:sulfur carrier protein ThiS [Arachidicoccus terrestris]UAY55894.1 sulfur carrier protein ThiS [Arachidicoccus terrestris]
MELEINQKKQNFSLEPAGADGLSNPLSLENVMEQLYPDRPGGIAVALHDQVIARANWPSTFLKEHDKLLILTATQGG